jgi:hypothetical protein
MDFEDFTPRSPESDDRSHEVNQIRLAYLIIYPHLAGYVTVTNILSCGFIHRPRLILDRVHIDRELDLTITYWSNFPIFISPTGLSPSCHLNHFLPPSPF